MSGKIYIIPNTLGNASLDNSIPVYTNKIIQNLDIYIVENKKSAIRFIKNICPEKSTSKLNFLTLNKFSDEFEISNYLNPCLNGQSIGLLSDAGCPAIADPGPEIIRMAHERKIKISLKPSQTWLLIIISDHRSFYLLRTLLFLLCD